MSVKAKSCGEQSKILWNKYNLRFCAKISLGKIQEIHLASKEIWKHLSKEVHSLSNLQGGKKQTLCSSNPIQELKDGDEYCPPWSRHRRLPLHLWQGVNLTEAGQHHPPHPHLHRPHPPHYPPDHHPGPLSSAYHLDRQPRLVWRRHLVSSHLFPPLCIIVLSQFYIRSNCHPEQVVHAGHGDLPLVLLTGLPQLPGQYKDLSYSYISYMCIAFTKFSGGHCLQSREGLHHWVLLKGLQLPLPGGSKPLAS